MVRSAALLRSYVHALLRLSGAESVSLFLAAEDEGSAPILLHEGADPVPELADLATAAELDRTHSPALRADCGADEPPRAIQIDSAARGCCLLRVPALSALLPEPEVPKNRRRRSDRETALASQAVWIGLRLGSAFPPSRAVPLSLPELPDDQGPAAEWWSWLLHLGGALAWHTRRISHVLDDPVTGLAGRALFQADLDHEVGRARRAGEPVTVLLMSPDDFAAINELHGRQHGDLVMQDVAARFRRSHRSTDLVAKYGGAIFASILVNTDSHGGTLVAQRLLEALSKEPYLDRRVRMAFRVGVATHAPGDEAVDSALELARRAEQALSSAKGEGERVAVWQHGSGAGSPDQGAEGALFTGEVSRDYRNMALLWETVTVIAGTSDFREIAVRVVDRVFGALRPDRVGLFHWPRGDGAELIQGLTKRLGESVRAEPAVSLGLGEAEQALIAEARRRGEAKEARLLVDNGELLCCAIPLLVGHQCVGCLYLDGGTQSLRLDSSDLVFLRALATQLAVVLDRARLSEVEKARHVKEQQRMQAELNELRRSLQRSRLVHRSRQMDEVLNTVRRAAPTDATVLITGESGTGKELVARSLHEQSARRHKPMVIVDCAAIPPTLIESELFGHERGAYTGAQQRRVGRLVEADGGTLLLDEIGEIPLEIQSRLLRFVQEKQVTPVGSRRVINVDVRLIAATNRDLAQEVVAGRFREDLYYRLNVVRLALPPLRDRPDDILLLASHFLERYATLYQRPVRRLTAEAEELALRSPWPGNARELENRIMQAVILAEGEELGPADLGLGGLGEAPEPRPALLQALAGRTPAKTIAAHGTPAPAPSRRQPVIDELPEALRRQVREALDCGGRSPAPLGRWLGHDLVLEANAVAGGVSSRAATLVGMPETTFRRRLDKAQAEQQSGLAVRPSSWQELREALARVVRESHSNGEPNGVCLMSEAQRFLLREVLGLVRSDIRAGSALLGVSTPTFRRRVAELEGEART